MSKYTDTLNELQRDLEKGEEALKKKLSRLYDSESKKLEKEIAYFYQTYGKDNVLEYRQMMKKLTKEEATMLYEDMDYFFRLHPEHAALRPVRQSIYKLNRLEGLQLSIMKQQLGLSSEEAALIGDHLLHYTISTYEGVQGLIPFNQFDGRAAKQVGQKIIRDTDFEKRLLANREKLADYLNNDIAKGIARGDSYDRLSKQICDRFDGVSRRSAYRLLYTEGTRMFNRANSEAFAEAGINQYRYCTAGDNRVCSDCKALDGNVYGIAEARDGINYPPMHPWCRCHTEPAVDWDKWLNDRIASREYTAEQREEAAEIIKNFKED